MEIEKIRTEMMSLWKETFGDSSEYVSLVFDSYFHPSKIAFREEKGNIVSALMGVPYDFYNNNGVVLKGLYLCGLATKKEARRRGLMSSIIEEINRKAMVEGYDFTFLIPSGEGKRRYYRDRGYHDAFFKKIEHYVRGHKFSEPDELTLAELTENDREKVLDFLADEGARPFGKENAYLMKHSRKDWEIVLREAAISLEPVIMGKAKDEISGVAFLKKEDREIEVKCMIAKKGIGKILLGEIGKFYPEFNITVVRDLEEVIEDEKALQIWSPFYASNNPKTAEYEDISETEQPYSLSKNAVSFGMIRIFDVHKLIEKTGWKNLNDVKGYSDDELKHLLLRRPVGKSSDALEKLLSLPELSLSMSLLLE